MVASFPIYATAILSHSFSIDNPATPSFPHKVHCVPSKSPFFYSSGTKKTGPSHPPEPKRSRTSITEQLKYSHTPTDDLPVTLTAQQELSTLQAVRHTAVKFCRTCTSPQLPQPSSPQPADQPQSLPPFTTHCTPLQPLSPVWYFNQYLVKFYSSPKDPVATWPPSPSEKFINLAAINRDEITPKEMHHFMLATLNKGVDTILEKKAPVQIEQLMDTKSGKEEKQKCVLVEGAPGVGKTTLSWEICKRWAEGSLFKQYSLILLLRLRDETVQNAVTVKDLVLYPYEEMVEGITQYLKYTNGTHTLILLEGLDELPQHLLTQSSIFSRLLAGTDLPDATILVTSRPSATTQLWKQWKQRITKHIEILGFTEDNITAYVASIIDPEQLPAFDTYLSTAPSIRQLMYIPLHSGIVVELYRMHRNSGKSLPTNKTSLYKALVETILTRYLARHPTYKSDDTDIDKFTDLPDDIYPIFMALTKLAYESVTRQQLIFKDKDKPVQHLGLMDVVAELFPNKRKVLYSYNFLHLSIQEYLGAVYISLKDTSIQEQLLESMCTKEHLQNMAMFLAGITKFKGMNQKLVRQAITRECVEERLHTLRLSKYCLELAFETDNISLGHGYNHYTYNLTQYSPLFVFTALGHFMASSRDKWELRVGSSYNYMQTTSGVDLLVQALRHHSDTGNSYTIDSIQCYYRDSKIAQHLLIGIPCHTLPLVEKLKLESETLQPLSSYLPRVIIKMNGLRVLELHRATAVTLADTLQDMVTASTYSLTRLDLSCTQFSIPAMQALCAYLQGHKKSIVVLKLQECSLTDDLACLLATGLQHRLPNLRDVYLTDNAIKHRGHVALDKCKTINKLMELRFY